MTVTVRDLRCGVSAGSSAMESYALGDVFAESGHKPASIVPLEDTQIQSFIENGAYLRSPAIWSSQSRF